MGNISIIQLRNKELDAIYSKVKKACNGLRQVSVATIVSVMSEEPAPRFYITPYTASLYLSRYRKIKGRGQKKEMVQDLMENFERLKKENPDAPKTWLYEKVVEQPAKSFYMSEERMKEIVLNYKKRNKRKDKDVN